MLRRYTVCFWLSEETSTNDLPDRFCSLEEETPDQAIVKAMHCCGVAAAVVLLWWEISPRDGTDILDGGWRFSITLENLAGMYGH